MGIIVKMRSAMPAEGDAPPDRRSGLFVKACIFSLAGICASACDLAQGLNDVGTTLINPDAALLDSPGRKLASGSYRRLLVDGSLEDGGHVVAIRSDRGEDEIAILPYLEGSGCHVSPGVGVERLSSKIDVELSGVIAVQRDQDENGRGEVAFVDFDCDEVLDSLPKTVLPQIVFPPSIPRGILALTADGDLYLVDVKDSALRNIASGVSIARTSGETLWTIEQGEFVGRDSNLDEFARAGSQVTDFVVTGGTEVTAAYHDESGLYTWSLSEGSELISETGCAAVAWDADSIAYSDPCVGGDLHIRTVGSRIGIDSEHVHIRGPSGVIFPERALVFWGQGARESEILLMVDVESSLGEQLVVARVPLDPEPVDEVYEMTVEVLALDGALIRGGMLYTDWNGESGTLVEQERDEENRTIGLLKIADGVAQLPGATPYSSAGVLTNFENGVGTLRAFTKTGDEIESTVIADGVPIQTQTVEVETGRRAFIAESDNRSTGTLYLTDEPSVAGSSLLGARAIARNVYVETARFLDQPRGVAYLAREEGESHAILKVWLIDSELTLTVHERVSEYRTVPWPAPGILYAVPSGSDRGLWFSKAR